VVFERTHRGARRPIEDISEDAVDTPPAAAERLRILEEAASVTRDSRTALKRLASTLEREVTSLREAGPTVAEQRMQWVVPVTQPMMLCSQVQRSGGTLLARLFDGHPACFSHPYELKWGRPRKWEWPQLDLSPSIPVDRLFAQLRESWPRKFAVSGYQKYSRWTYRQQPELVRRYPFVFDAALQRTVFAHLLSQQPPRSQRDALNAYLTSLFNAWLDYQNLYRVPKQWVTAFVPRLIMEPGSIERFFADYPDGLLVSLVRDPHAWLSSIDPQGVRDTQLALHVWMKSTEASVRAHARHSDKVIVLIFDDLVERTEAVMRTLCRRMGIAFQEVLLEPTYNSMPVLSDSSHAPATGVDRSATTRHTDTITAEQRAIVADAAMPLFDEIRGRVALTHDA
jgi:hypothetical protein